MAAVDRAIARDRIAIERRALIRERVVVHDGGHRIEGVFHLLVLAGVLAVIVGSCRIRLDVSSLQRSFERSFVIFIDDVLFSIAALLELELVPCAMDICRSVVGLPGVFRRNVDLAFRDLAGIRRDARPVDAFCVRQCAGRHIRAFERIVSIFPENVVLDALARAGIRIIVFGLLHFPCRRMVDSIVYGVIVILLDIVCEEIAGSVVFDHCRAVVFLRDIGILEAEIDLTRRNLGRIRLLVARITLGYDVIVARRAAEGKAFVDDILVDDVAICVALDILRAVLARR